MLELDLASLAPARDWSRREFVMTALASGFALAVEPVSAQTITTDTKDLEAGEVTIPARDGEIPAYRALPESGGPFPTVLVVQEIFGVHEHIKDLARRFAKQGYFAVAPELFARQGDVSKLTSVQDILATVVSRVPDAQVMADLDAAVAWVHKTGRAAQSRLAVTGFCWGGRITWLYCAHNPRVRAGAAWYGRLVGPTSEFTPRQPVDIAETLAVPVLGLYGGADSGIPLDTVERMRTALGKGRSGSEIVVYADAPHGFNADYRPSYRSDVAANAWSRMLTWFGQHGAA